MRRKLLKIFGYKGDNVFTWGEFYWHVNPFRWQLTLKLTKQYGKFNDLLTISPFIFTIYISLPSQICPPKNIRFPWEEKSYGFYIYESLKNFHNINVLWGKKRKRINMPWYKK